jgi:hypothetical protein
MSAITIETTYTAARDQRKALLDGLCLRVGHGHERPFIEKNYAVTACDWMRAGANLTWLP